MRNIANMGPGMGMFRRSKMRWLYLLALAQLVGGPLVLLQLTVLCKLTLHETPRLGLARATVSAWHSDEFQTVLASGATPAAGDTKNKAPLRDPKPEPDKVKSPALPWESAHFAWVIPSSDAAIGNHQEFWTPDWPHAPPAPPPRVA
jgi:hypothetical protein